MHRTHNRPERVAGLIQQTLAELLLRQASDPRFTLVTITAVKVTADLADAKVYVTMLDESRIQEAVTALNHAAGYFRHLLADKIELRIVPRLRFIYDESISRADKLYKLIDESLSDPNKSSDPDKE